MDSRLVAVIVVGIVAISATALTAVYLLDNKEYNITYMLDGGVNSEDNPSSYRTNSVTELFAAEKEGYVFIGWFTDEDLTEQITEISSGTSGDLTLYACWEKSEVGMCYTYDLSGTSTRSYYAFFNSTTNITGTVSYTFLTYRYGHGYYMSYEETITTGSGKLSKTTTNSDTYWSGDSETVWNMGSDKTINTIYGYKECRTWISTTNTSTEIQYVGIDDDITYLIEYSSNDNGTKISLTYTLSSSTITVLDDEFTVTVYCDKDVSVTGSGVSEAYSTVTLTASGSSFTGWYSTSDELLSTSATYKIETLVSDITIYARNGDTEISSGTERVVTSTTVALDDVVWTFDDNGTEITRNGSDLDYTFSSAGSYVLLYTGTRSDGSTYHGLLDVIADGYITKNYEWKYSSKTFTASLNIKYSDFLEYRNDDISRSQGSNSHDLTFVTYNDPYITNLIGQILDQCTGKTDEYKANVILAFTQYIEYQYDSDSMGQDEYWKYPLETLFDQNGDCEDTSILFCALAKAGGYDCALILFSGHMAAGISLDSASGSYYQYNGVKYYYCETTATGWYVGSTPGSEYSTALRIIPVTSSA